MRPREQQRFADGGGNVNDVYDKDVISRTILRRPFNFEKSRQKDKPRLNPSKESKTSVELL